MFDLTQWRARLTELLADFRRHPRQAAGETLFWTLVSLTLLPLAPALADNPFAAGVALAGIVGGVGANLLANLVGRLRAVPPDRQTDIVAEALAASADLRAAVDDLMAQLDVVGQAPAGLSDADRRWFVQTLQSNLAAFPDDFPQARRAVDLIIRAGGHVAYATEGSISTVGDGNVSVLGSVTGPVIMAREGSRVSVGAAEPGSDPSALRRAYLGRVTAACNVLPISAIDPHAGDKARERVMTLAAVYTALDTTTLVPVEPDKESRRPRQRRAAEAQALLALERGETRPLSALEAAARERQMVLLGGPGSGKSTLGRWLALCLARAALEPDGGWLARLGDAWPHGPLLPVHVVLRDFAASPGCDGTAGGLWDFITGTLAADGLGDYAPLLRKEILAGGVFVILDGLDEVAQAARRTAVRDAVQAFAAVYGQPRNRYLISCRPYAYADPAGQLTDFPAHTLAPFNQEAVDAFVAAWYAEVRALGWKTAAEAADLTARLQAAVRRPDLAPLASNPLQLTMMASLHTSWGRLPDDRAVLYDEMVELLLVRWQEARLGADAGVSQTVNPAELRRALECAAFQAHRDQAGAEGTADLRELDLCAALRACVGGSLDGAAALTAYIRQRAGLLVEREPGIYTFPHRSYQEYLAGCYLAVQPDFPDQAAALARENLAQWREVVLWAVAAMARVKGMTYVAVDVVNALCPREFSPRRPVVDLDWQLVALAGEALLEIGVRRLEEPRHVGVLERVQHWLVALLQRPAPLGLAGERGALPPADRAAAGRVLGHLGDPRPDVCCDAPFLVDVPAGPFLMGSTRETVVRWKREGWDWPEQTEQPQHEVTLPAYGIGKYPVTVAQYRRFVEDGGYTERWRSCWTAAGWTWQEERGIIAPEYWNDPRWTTPNHPAVGVSWYEAVAYCRWLAATTGQNFRLPTEAEWEKAARGGDGREWPWGNEWEPGRSNTEMVVGQTTAVGLFPGDKSPYGLLDMAGNVWEWCATKWQDNYRSYRDDNDLTGDDARVVRGGSFYYDRRLVRCAYRFRRGPYDRDVDIGFRVVLASPPSSGL